MVQRFREILSVCFCAKNDAFDVVVSDYTMSYRLCVACIFRFVVCPDSNVYITVVTPLMQPLTL